MLSNERHEKIIQLLKKEKQLATNKISSLIFASEATVRRDLIEMEKLGLIERIHGGAIISDHAEDVSLFVRMVKNSKEKESIATTALKHVPKFNSLFVDGSSTALALVERMNLEHKTVITYSLQTAMRLIKKNNINLYFLGGKVNFDTLSTTGSYTTMQLNDYAFDLMISSCSSLINGEVFENSFEQKTLKQVALQKSTYKILLVDDSKFERLSPHKSSTTDCYDLIVCNKKPPINYQIDNLIY